nr:hypothetical protein [Tanacetum cinerariifolium]
MEDTMFDLVKICHHKQFLCIHDDIDNLIKSALDSKLLSINSQRLDKKEQEVKNDNDDLDSRDDESLSDEDVPVEEFKIYSNPLCDEDKINFDKLDPHCFNVEYDFVESLLNRDTFIDFSSKFDFSGELAHIKPEIPKSDVDFEEEIREADLFLSDDSIPPGIENVADDPEGDVRFLEELLINDSILSHESFDSNFEENSSIPRPPSEPPDVESFFDLKPD